MPTAAGQLVEAYLAESIEIRNPPPRLGDVPSARELHAADVGTRVGVALECARRIRWETENRYYITPYMMGSPLRRWLQNLKQILFPQRHGMERAARTSRAALQFDAVPVAGTFRQRGRGPACVRERPRGLSTETCATALRRRVSPHSCARMPRS